MFLPVFFPLSPSLSQSTSSYVLFYVRRDSADAATAAAAASEYVDVEDGTPTTAATSSSTSSSSPAAGAGEHTAMDYDQGVRLGGDGGGAGAAVVGGNHGNGSVTPMIT